MVRNVRNRPDCHGTGKVIKEKCPTATEPAIYASKKKIQVSIPAGKTTAHSDPGQRRTRCQRRPRGDLLVEVVVSRHPVFQRQDVNISPPCPSALHRRHWVENLVTNTVDGPPAIYDVKPGTQTDTMVRLKGKGTFPAEQICPR